MMTPEEQAYVRKLEETIVKGTSIKPIFQR